jgi:hypothetical protein
MDKHLEALARQERLEYFRKWRAANKDKVKRHNSNYWIKRAKQRMEAEKWEGK